MKRTTQPGTTPTPVFHTPGRRVKCRAKAGLLIFVGLLTALPAVADVLIVTKEGKSFWATSARKEGETVLYLDKESGEEKKAPISTLDGLIPVVQRGKAYKPDEIQKHVDDLRKLKNKYPGLLRQLNELLQGWEVLTRPSPEFEGQITNLAREFAVSDKGTKAYNKVTLDLGMIKFKDVQATFATRIDGICAEIRKEYVATNMERLVRMAASEKLAAESFVPIKRLAEPVGGAAEAGDKEKIKALVAKARQMAFDVTCRQAESVFASGKSVEAYLKSSALLFLVRKEVADTAELKAAVEKRIAALRDAAGRTASGYSLEYDGFPMSENDEQLLSKTRSFAGRVTFTSMQVDEQCEMLPAQSPGRLRLRQPFALPVRLIFNCAQPTNRVFGMVVMMTGRNGTPSHTVRLPAFQIQKGHADVTFREDFSMVDKDFELGRDKRGDTFLYAYLACLDDNPDALNEEWIPLSTAWAFPISP